MAVFTPSRAPSPIVIDKFLGLNESIGETEILLGQAVKQINFRITQNYKAQKRQGHRTFIDYENNKPVRGVWYGVIKGKEVLISCNDGKVYEYNFSTKENTQIGAMTDAETSIFYFESKLYFINGHEYKEYDGETFQDVEGYVPTVVIASMPAGGGTEFEPINLLTGRKKQEFQGDGNATTYQLVETDIDDDEVTCTINGETKTEGTHFTVNRTAGTINFAGGTSPHGAPANGALVAIEWTKVDETHRDLVVKNRYAMTFGPGNDTCIFLWGNPDAKNRRTWSGTLKANYFPVFNFTLIGTDEFAITDIKAVYNRQIIFKEDRTYYSPPEFIANTNTYDYPVYDLNEKVGNVAYNGVQILKNLPLSLYGNQFWYWVNTNVEDERNAEPVSSRIKESLTNVDLRNAVTFDYQKEGEYWCNVGDKVYIWNYGNDTFYIFDNIEATCFLDIDGTVYYGSKGTIEVFDGVNDNGEPINAELELGFTDFGVNELHKNTRKLWITVQPESKSSVDVLYTTNKTFLSEPRSISVAFNLLDFALIDFGNFSFLTNRAPVTYRRKIRAKKYAYIKFIFRNNKLDESLTLLALKLTAETTSEVK